MDNGAAEVTFEPDKNSLFPTHVLKFDIPYAKVSILKQPPPVGGVSDPEKRLVWASGDMFDSFDSAVEYSFTGLAKLDLPSMNYHNFSLEIVRNGTKFVASCLDTKMLVLTPVFKK